MKAKTARRFLRRNSWTIAKHNLGIHVSPSIKRRIKEAIRVVTKSMK